MALSFPMELPKNPFAAEVLKTKPERDAKPNFDAKKAWSDLENSAGLLDQAEQTASRLSNDSNRSWVAQEMIRANLEIRRVDDARRLLVEISGPADLADAHARLAVIVGSLGGDPESDLAAVESIVKQHENPDIHDAALQALVIGLARLGKTERAKRAAQLFEMKDAKTDERPVRNTTLAEVAVIEARRGELESATQAAEAISDPSTRFATLQRMTHALLHKGQINEAKGTIKRIPLSPDTAEEVAEAYRAIMETEQKQRGSVSEELKRAHDEAYRQIDKATLDTKKQQSDEWSQRQAVRLARIGRIDLAERSIENEESTSKAAVAAAEEGFYAEAHKLAIKIKENSLRKRTLDRIGDLDAQKRTGAKIKPTLTDQHRAEAGILGLADAANIDIKEGRDPSDALDVLRQLAQDPRLKSRGKKHKNKGQLDLSYLASSSLVQLECERGEFDRALHEAERIRDERLLSLIATLQAWRSTTTLKNVMERVRGLSTEKQEKFYDYAVKRNPKIAAIVLPLLPRATRQTIEVRAAPKAA